MVNIINAILENEISTLNRKILNSPEGSDRKQYFDKIDMCLSIRQKYSDGQKITTEEMLYWDTLVENQVLNHLKCW